MGFCLFTTSHFQNVKIAMRCRGLKESKTLDWGMNNNWFLLILSQKPKQSPVRILVLENEYFCWTESTQDLWKLKEKWFNVHCFFHHVLAIWKCEILLPVGSKFTGDYDLGLQCKFSQLVMSKLINN